MCKHYMNRTHSDSQELMGTVMNQANHNNGKLALQKVK